MYNSDEEFELDSILYVLLEIKSNNYPSEIESISKVDIGRCEWCNNTSRRIRISLRKTSAETFTNGYCNSGLYTIYEDSSFHPQCEWHVCGKCKDS